MFVVQVQSQYLILPLSVTFLNTPTHSLEVNNVTGVKTNNSSLSKLTRYVWKDRGI